MSDKNVKEFFLTFFKHIMIFVISGQSSFQETLCYQKPVVAIPVSGDQPINANEAQRLGIGISHPYGSMNEEGLYEVHPYGKKRYITYYRTIK